jgi:hypothetical protein
MSLILADRVRETSTTSGTGALTLAGAVTGFQRFSAVCSVGDEVQYVITEGASWEVGVGIYSGTNTLTRSTVLASSNAGSLVSFTGASKDVVLTLPARAAAGVPNRNLLLNSRMDVWQRTDPATYTTLADKGMGPDGWFVLSESGNVQAKRDADGNYLSSCILKQNHGSDQRFGIGQVLYSVDTKRTGDISSWWAQAKVVVSTGVAIRAAVLHWSGTVDSADRDLVGDWASTTYTAGNFFHANWTPLSVIESASATTHLLSFPVPATDITSNVALFIWTPTQRANAFTMEVSRPILSDAGCPQIYRPKSYSDELTDCLRRFCKSFGFTTAPVQNIGNAQGALRATGNGSGVDIDWRFPVPMRKVPTCTTFNTSAANANWRDQTAGADRTATLGTPTSSAVVINAGSTTTGNQMSIHATAEAEPCS